MRFFITLEDYSEKVREGIIKETSNIVLIDYAMQSINPKDRAAVAMNINTSELRLKILSTDRDIEVRRAVLYNKKTSGKIIDKMLKDDETFGYENLIVNHPNVHKETLERYVKCHNNESLKIKAQQRLMYM